jgi:hypothetical protein
MILDPDRRSAPENVIKGWPTAKNAANRTNAARRQHKRMMFCAKCDKAMPQRHKCAIATS